ncbi:hypothetical protein L7F22_020092 [Adiantum nelumboides]|nr:hypothetical protein [Adiantum nelumboides]
MKEVRYQQQFHVVKSQVKLNKVDPEVNTSKPTWLEDYVHIFPEDLTNLLLNREIDHEMEILLESELVSKRPYKMSLPEAIELKEQLCQLIEQGFIRPNKSSWGAPALFQKKKDGTLRFCIDYRGLNHVTVKEQLSLTPHRQIIGPIRVFTKIDLRSGYYQIRNKEGNIPKTAFNTRYGHFEFIVMSFGLTNVPATFNRLMQDIFRSYLDDFVLVFFDNILVYSKNEADHEDHLQKVLDILCKHKLYAKLSKCTLFSPKIEYLGFILSQDGISIDPAKVQDIIDWPIPTNSSEPRGSLGITGCSCISWLSKKQPTVATSSCEAEYRAVFTATVECVWLRRLMADLRVGQDIANTIYTDSQIALAIARNLVFHARTKHIKVHYHYVRERLSAGEISLAYMPTQDNFADLFTKAFSHEKLEAFRKALGLLPFVD